MSDEINDVGVVGKDYRHDPFTKLTAHAIEYVDNGLSSTDLAVMAALFSFFHNSKRGGFPSQESVAKRARVSVRTVKRSIKRLEECGYIKVEHRFKGGRQWSNIYHATDDYLEIFPPGRTNEVGEGDADDTPQ